MLVDHILMLLLLQRIFSEVPSIDAFIVTCGPLIMDAFLVLDGAFSRCRISPIIKGLLILVFFRMVHTQKNFSEDLVLSTGRFQKVMDEVIIYKKMKSCHKLSKNCTNMIKIGKFLVRIVFIPWNAFIIYKIKEKPGQMYQKCFITYSLGVSRLI